MYLILSDAEGNATPEVFHDGVDVIGLRIAEEEKSCWKRFVREDLIEISVVGDSAENIRRRRSG